MTLKLRKWDSAEYLKTEEVMVLYLAKIPQQITSTGIPDVPLRFGLFFW